MKVTLRNLKGITSLEFEVPDPGVWIVSGLNGSGKTSLFASLYRLGYNNAFQKYFRAGSPINRVDRYTNTEVEYLLNGQTVTYRYGGQRWRANPRKNAGLLGLSTYPDVYYIEANAERIEPYPNEITTRRIKSCSTDLCSFLADTLGESKWNSLKYVNTIRGNSKERAYLIPYTENSKTYYYSERSFSLGELCVLKLANKILNAKNGSLVLIDEVEMALHPQAQVRLLAKIQNIAQQKSLTVLFSTHSSTLIKNCSRNRLIHLRPGSTKIEVQYNPYPAQILGEIAFDEELVTDFIFFVEDREAKLLLEQMILRYMDIAAINPSIQPKYKIVPVGGYIQVLELLSSTYRLIPPYVKKFALLDQDVEPIINDALRKGLQPLATLFTSVRSQVSYLPWTPELGIIEFIEQVLIRNRTIHADVVSEFPGAVINLIAIVNAPAYQQYLKVNLRDRAKDRFRHLAQEISALSQIDEIHVKRIIYRKFVEHKYSSIPGQLRAFFGPLFNAP